MMIAKRIAIFILRPVNILSILALMGFCVLGAIGLVERIGGFDLGLDAPIKELIKIGAYPAADFLIERGVNPILSPFLGAGISATAFFGGIWGIFKVTSIVLDKIKEGA